MNSLVKKISAVVLLTFVLLGTVVSVKTYAAETALTQEAVQISADADVTSTKAWAGGLAIGIAAAAGAIAMAIVVMKTLDGVARQPEAEGKLRTTMMLGLVFVETAIIYALIVVILIIFVL